MTERILTEYKQKIDSLELIPASGGAFELSVNGKLIYSKLETGQFPDEAEMVSQVGANS